MKDVIVRKLQPKPDRDRHQCQFPKNKLKAVGYRGYREIRASRSGADPRTCMRDAAWGVDGRYYCMQHAGQIVLEHLDRG